MKLRLFAILFAVITIIKFTTELSSPTDTDIIQIIANIKALRHFFKNSIRGKWVYRFMD